MPEVPSNNKVKFETVIIYNDTQECEHPLDNEGDPTCDCALIAILNLDEDERSI